MAVVRCEFAHGFLELAGIDFYLVPAFYVCALKDTICHVFSQIENTFSEVKLAIMTFGAFAAGHRYKAYQNSWDGVCRAGRGPTE